MSKGEDIIELVNRAAVINPNTSFLSWQKEKTFTNLKYKGHLLRFDFAIYQDNEPKLILQEFDGQQHFDEVKFFHNFKHMKENDRRKNQYCLDNNIPLYRIPYWDLDKIKTIDDILQDKYLVKSKYHNDNLIWKYKQKHKG